MLNCEEKRWSFRRIFYSKESH